MVLATLILAAIFGQAPEPVVDLVRQLGADEPAAREEAERRLGEIGEPAETALRDAVASGDPEVRERAGHVLDRIVRLREEREFGERFRALATTFGERRCGPLVMKTRIERWGVDDLLLGECLVFEDHVGAWCQVRCEFTLDPPRLKSFAWTMHDSGEVAKVSGTDVGGFISLEFADEGVLGSRMQLYRLPPRLFVAYEYYRLACVVRRAEGQVLPFTQFVIGPHGEIFCASELRCIGRERVGEGDPWRIEYWRADPGAPEMTRIMTLWVTDDGELIQVQPEDGKAIPVEK